MSSPTEHHCLANFPGGFGAEVGVYRRISGKAFPAALDFLPPATQALVRAAFAAQPHSDFWWPVTDRPFSIEPNDRLFWFSLFPGGGGRVTIPPGGTVSWDGAGQRTAVQVVFWVAGVRIGPKLCACTAVTIDQGGVIINDVPRPPRPQDLVHHVVVLMMENRSFDNLLGWL